MIVVIYLGWVRPLRVLNLIEVSNEVGILVCTYFYMLFTDVNLDSESKWVLGWYFIGTVCLVFLANLTVVITVVFRVCLVKVK